MSVNTLQKRLRETFATMGTKNAVEWGNQVQTYSELDKASDKVAQYIIGKGIPKGSFIGMLIENKLELITIIIGILKAGCVFIPLDPGYPNHRIKIMMSSTDTQWLLVDQPMAEKLVKLKEDQELAIEMILVNELLKEVPDTGSEARKVAYEPEDKIYIYFTSGTTGQPKAIIGQNKSLLHFVNWEIETFHIEAGTRVSQFTSPSHDPFLRDIFVPLCCGGTICIPENREIILDTMKLVDWINRSKVAVIHCTPSLFNIFNQNRLKNSEDYQALKYVLLAGEKIHPKALENWLEIFSDRIELINLYGPTETTLAKTYYPIQRTDLQKAVIPIGKPISGTKVIILDSNMEICNIGDIGEIYIRTPYRSLGYYQDPERNAERFIVNPFNQDPNDVIYKTGDMGRLLPDGNIELLGRVDRQVKIRGFRVELDEIEQVLLEHEMVKEAAVVERETEHGELQIYAWVVLEPNEQELNVQGLTVILREYLKKQLPEYMIPQAFIPRQAMPLNANGKINYKTLRENIDLFLNETKYLPPRDELESQLAQIWQEILNIERVGIRNSFLELGGHSLNIMELIFRIFKDYEVELSLDSVFNYMTIESLAQYIRTVEKGVYAEIEPAPVKEYYPVSSAQKRLYILDQFEGAGTSYNNPGVFEIEGNLDKERLEYTLQQLIKRHESFQTSFELAEGDLVQRIHPEVEFQMNYQELGSGEVDIQETISEIIQAFIRPFDLSLAPLVRAGLLKISDSKHLLMFDMHHIIADGTSLTIVIRDFAAIYNGEQLTDLKVQYKDFSEWQHQSFRGETIKRQETYWLNQFAGEILVLDLPTDYPRPAVQNFAGDAVNFEIDQALTSRLNQLVVQNEATLYIVLLAVYNIFLAKYSGQEDIVVGSPIAGRPHVDLENIIGMFVNTLAMRNYPVGDKTFQEFLMEVKAGALQAYDNQDYPFEELVEKLDLKRDLSRNPLFDTMFVLHNQVYKPTEISGLAITPYPYENKIAKFDLTLQAVGENNGIYFTLEYCTKLFKPETIQRMVNHIIHLIEVVVSNPEVKLSEIELISKQEKQRILYELNDTKAEYPHDKTIQELFEEQVERVAGNIALVYEDREMTYGELNQKSNQLARILREKGVRAESIIGLMVERSLEMLIGMIGILKAGGAYLPIDPEYPEERIKFMLEDSNTGIVLSQSHLKEKFSLKQEVINLDDQEIYHCESSNLAIISQPNNLAYVIYTSGSTGKPKGVEVEHKAVINFIKGISDRIDFSSGKVILSVTTMSFDIHVLETLLPLTKGLKIIIANGEQQTNPIALAKIISDNKVEIIQTTPSRIKLLLENNTQSDNQFFPHLKEILLGGEALPESLLMDVKKTSKAKIFNMYGPTETTVWSTMSNVTGIKIVNIGKPIANTRIYIVDKNNSLQPIGIRGELCIAGAGLAREYIGRPEITTQKFVDNPFEPGERMYRTGDLARWLPDGNIEFLGRMDQQVKLRGFRIELGEIESQLVQYEGIKEAVVVSGEDKTGARYLCAYLTAEKELSITKIREYLSKELPDYMIPSYFVQLEKLPLTSNGKLNRNALPEPEGSIRTGAVYIAPRNENEVKLVEVWQKVLGVEKVGIRDNFLILGGDSIKAIQIASRLHNLGLKVELKDLFQHQTIEELSEYLTQTKRRGTQGAIEGRVELTPIQRWFFEQSFSEPYHFNQSVMLYSKEGFDEVAIKKVFDKILEHHDALRMVFQTEADGIVQYNQRVKAELFSLTTVDVSGESVTEGKIIEMANQIQASIDLDKGPLVKLGLFKTDNGAHLLIVVHYLVIDGVSWQIIMEDIANAYQQYKQGTEIAFPVKTDSFQEWAQKQVEYGASKTLCRELSYWNNLEINEIKRLPRDYEVQTNQIKDSHCLTFSLTQVETEQLLKQVNQAYHTEINDLLLTALGLAIKKWCGKNQVLISMEGNGRETIIQDIDISRTVGCFTSVYPVILDMTKSEDLGNQIKLVKENIRRIPNKGIGYGILKYLTPNELKGSLKFSLKPEIRFNYLGQFDQDVATEIVGISPLASGEQISGYNKRLYTFDINGMVAGGRLSLTLNYNKNEYREETIRQLTDRYIESLQEIIGHCLERESEITPSDLGDKELSLEELKKIIDIIS